MEKEALCAFCFGKSVSETVQESRVDHLWACELKQMS